MKDERIETTVNHIAARVLLIWQLLVFISLVYRILILKQHIRDYWDVFAILFIGSLCGFIAFANKGVFDHVFKRIWLTIFIVGITVIFTVFCIMGQIDSVVDVGLFLIGVLPGLGLVTGIAYFLNRRWKRKEGLEDEK